MGAIFCHVIKIKLFIHLNPSEILGNQKWKGAAPIFNNIMEEIKIFNKLKFWNKFKFKNK